jgi:myo-inositol-1(or 4)-monophosphatase
MSPTLSPTLLRRCLDVASRAAVQTGKLLASRAGRPKDVRTKTSAIDLVTEVDKAAEGLLHRAIAKHFPDHGFQGEERTNTNPDAAYRWIVDPLDGTINFVHGAPMFAISIGLLHGREPVVGVIYDPIRRELFTAMKGGGARLNGRRMRVSGTDTMAASLLSTGFSLAFRRVPTEYLRWLVAFERGSHAVRRIGTTAISLAWLAAGRLDGFYERELAPWDFAGGTAIVREAGGRVTDFDGHPITVGTERSRLVASNGRIHDEMLAVLAPQTRSSRLSTSR